MIKFGPHLILLLSLLGWGTSAVATHIIGGVLTYEHLGSNDYEVTLKLYRDCGPGNTNGTGFDPTVTIGFFDSSNNLFTSVQTSNLVVTAVPVVQNNPCLTPPPVCVEEGVYVVTVNVVAPAGGLTLAYQRCCRNPTILNLTPQQGITASTQIPEAALFPDNSSPTFNDFPPIAICVNDTLNFDHSATDIDGDMLVYSLCDPFAGGSPVNPNPGIPPSPPYNAINWVGGYSAAAPLDGTISIDPVTGMLTALPNMQGQYVVGVCVEEYRNGTLLSTVKRDFQFNVTACIINTVSAVQSQQSFCSGTTVNFINQSNAAIAYSWDFGVPGILSDTSDLFQPSYTFPDTGVYQVRLIANPTWPCADTSFSTFALYNPIVASTTVTDVSCFDAQPLNMSVSGNFGSAAVINWDLGLQALNQNPTGASIVGTWSQSGTFPISVTVQDYGCTGTALDTTTIFANPVSDFTWDPQGCAPFTSVFVDNSTADTPLNYLWDFGDGATSTMSNPPAHVYSTSGNYDLSLTVWTDSGCVDTSSLVVNNGVLVQAIPTAFFTVNPLQVDVLDPTFTVLDGSVDAINWSYQTNDLTFTTPNFTHTFNGGGYFSIVQTVTNDVGCSDTYSLIVPVRGHLFYAPNAFTPNGDGINDVWLPSAQGALSYELQIYDRWGSLIFNTQDAFEPFVGENASIGVYQYRVKIQSAGGFPHLYTGHFSLIR